MLDKQMLDKHNQIYYTVFYTENKDIIDRIILDTSIKSKLPKEELLGDAYINMCRYIDAYTKIENPTVDISSYVEGALRLHYKYYYSIKDLPTNANVNKYEMQSKLEIGWDVEDDTDILSPICLYDVIDRLPNDRLRTIVYMLYDGYTVRDIANTLHLSIQSIYNALYECREDTDDPAIYELYEALGGSKHVKDFNERDKRDY